MRTHLYHHVHSLRNLFFHHRRPKFCPRPALHILHSQCTLEPTARRRVLERPSQGGIIEAGRRIKHVRIGGGGLELADRCR
jgi:hypothetical protein